MGRIPEFTRTVLKNRANPSNIAAQQLASGGNEAASLNQSAQENMRNAEIVGQFSDEINAIQQKKQTRYETVQRARAVSTYKNELNNDFMAFESEMDLTNPDAPKEFSRLIRGKQAEYLKTHNGGKESLANLEIQLTALSDQFALKMSESGRAAQREFITNEIGTHINRIANEVYQDPSSIDMAFKQLDGLSVEYGAALDSVDEMQLIENAQSMIVEGAVNSFLDAGDYESAHQLVMNNTRFIEDMPAKQQMSLLGRIKNGVAAQEKERNELTRKMNAIEGAAQDAGVEISKSQLFSAVTGIKENQTPDQKVDQFAQIAGLSPQQITPAIVAKIGFGVDLPSGGDIDMNKERLPDGGYTPKGIGAIIKAPYENAANTKVLVDKVLLQSNEFLDSENSQAGLAALISFQKLIDDGAMVREGDIKLSAQGNSAYDNIKLMLDKLEKGAIATPRQVEQMKRSAEIFGQAVLEASKTYIDPYLEESTLRGYRMIDIGLPKSSYDRVFKDIKTNEDINKRNTEIEQKAASFNMSVNEYLTATAQRHNMTVKQVADKLGYTGAIE